MVPSPLIPLIRFNSHWQSISVRTASGSVLVGPSSPRIPAGRRRHPRSAASANRPAGPRRRAHFPRTAGAAAAHFVLVSRITARPGCSGSCSFDDRVGQRTAAAVFVAFAVRKASTNASSWALGSPPSGSTRNPTRPRTRACGRAGTRPPVRPWTGSCGTGSSWWCRRARDALHADGADALQVEQLLGRVEDAITRGPLGVDFLTAGFSIDAVDITFGLLTVRVTGQYHALHVTERIVTSSIVAV